MSGRAPQTDDHEFELNIPILFFLRGLRHHTTSANRTHHSEVAAYRILDIREAAPMVPDPMLSSARALADPAWGLSFNKSRLSYISRGRHRSAQNSAMNPGNCGKFRYNETADFANDCRA